MRWILLPPQRFYAFACESRGGSCKTTTSQDIKIEREVRLSVHSDKAHDRIGLIRLLASLLCRYQISQHFVLKTKERAGGRKGAG